MKLSKGALWVVSCRSLSRGCPLPSARIFYSRIDDAFEGRLSARSGRLIELTPIHIGEPATPPRIAPARAPPDWLEANVDQTHFDESEETDPVSEFEFDQTVSW